MIRLPRLLTLSLVLVLARAAHAQTANVHDSVASVSRAQLGSRYRLGAVQPGRRFDCSGLVQYVMSVFHVLLPRTAAEQARLGVAVARDPAQLLPGDILTFGRGRRITHVGIYVGEGRYIHASSHRRTVIEVPLPDPDSREGHLWKGARRVLPQPLVESPAS
jgi:cell wall-associated NlpC family hydrolase